MPHIRPFLYDMSLFNFTLRGQAYCHYYWAVMGQFSVTPCTDDFLKNLKKKN